VKNNISAAVLWHMFSQRSSFSRHSVDRAWDGRHLCCHIYKAEAVMVLFTYLSSMSKLIKHVFCRRGAINAIQLGYLENYVPKKSSAPEGCGCVIM
jgi:hypothetical protein